MKKILILVIFLYTLFLFFTIYNKQVSQPHFISPTPTVLLQPTKMVLGTIHSTESSKCYSDGILPDLNCTPGAIDPSVTQENIFQTICVRGYTKTVRPPVSYTNNLKREQIKEYGFSDSNMRDYEEDHLISLELGGSPSDPKNLWPEPEASPNRKDAIENLCHKKICKGELLLADAQRQIASNWQTACQ